MPSLSKRIAVVWDVLNTLKKRNITPLAYIKKKLDLPDLDLSHSIDISKEVPKLEQNCHVCALGSCLLSYMDIYDNISMNNFNIDCDGNPDLQEFNIVKMLSKAFSEKQLALIEAAFEYKEFNPNNKMSYQRLPPIAYNMWRHMFDDDKLKFEKDMLKAQKFGKRYPNNKTRLKKIMENILQHGGRFAPA